MKKGVDKLPRIEWDFEEVPVAERWMCALWEFSRSSKRACSQLPDYRNILSIQSAAPLMASDETPLAVRLLNRVLTAYTNFRKEQKASIDNSVRASSPNLVLRKNRALENLVGLDRLGPLREEALNLFVSLSVDDAEKLTASLQKCADSKSPEIDARIQRVVDRFREKTAVNGYICPFPETPWMLLDEQSRTVLAKALIDDEFVGDISDWHGMLTSGEEFNRAPVDFAKKYSYPRVCRRGGLAMRRRRILPR